MLACATEVLGLAQTRELHNEENWCEISKKALQREKVKKLLDKHKERNTVKLDKNN